LHLVVNNVKDIKKPITTHKFNRMNKFFFAILLSSMAITSYAQKNTQGLYLGLSIAGGNIYYDDDNLSNKDPFSGLDLRIGYGLNSTTTLFLGIGGYEAEGQEEDLFRDNYTAGLFELGARFHFGKKMKNPIFYAEAALQGAAADYSDEIDFQLSGGGIGLGGGLLLYVGETFAFDIGLKGSWGTINEADFGGVSVDLSDENFGYSFTRLNVGVTWYPFRKNTVSQ
jgi:hypothetical protein